MSLSPEQFADHSERNRQRFQNGVSVTEAENDLSMLQSSISLVAEETASWLYKNWTIEKFFQLNPAARLRLLRFIECKFLAEHAPNAEPPWHKVIETDLLRRNGIQ